MADLHPGDILHLHPETDPHFGGCLLLVTDPERREAVALVPNARGARQVPFTVGESGFDVVGRVER